MRKLIDWCRKWFLPGAALFFVAFIPLYPKLPILDIEQSWVYIRIEDFLVAMVSLVLCIQFLYRKKLSDSPLTFPIILYWTVGLVSLINALVFIFPNFGGILFPKVAIFHYIRRIEYLFLFFVGYEAIKARPTMTARVLWVLGITVLIVSLYGFGQKFLGFPAFLTMNEEFAKGTPLRLPTTARFPSTFGGHYDLAAYLVMTIPIIASMVFGAKKLWVKAASVLVSVLALIMLLFTASRVSFGVYLIAISAMLWMQKKKLWILPVVVVSIIIMNFTSGVSERYAKTLRFSDVVVDLSTGKPIGTLDKLEGGQAHLAESENPAKETLPTGSEFIGVGANGGKKAGTVTMYSSKNLATGSGEISTMSGSFLIQKALVYDISITTRFQGQWPKAMAAFRRNIMLGSGYSALSVAADGDYHRMLGETGILGTIAFLGIFAYAWYLFATRIHLLTGIERSFTIGVFAGFLGLLVNAVLIDVFEASKVAFSFYLLFGIAIYLLAKEKTERIAYLPFLRRLFTHKIAWIVYLVGAVFWLWSGALSMYFTGDDFTWLKWAAQSNISTIMTNFSSSEGFFYRPIPKLWYFVLYNVFWLTPVAYHVMSLLLVSATVYLLFTYLRLHNINWVYAFIASLLFGTMSVHHENIFWVSGQSSLLAGFFAMLSLVFLEKSKTKRRTWTFWFVGSVVSILFSVLSYDGMALLPLGFFALSLLAGHKGHSLWFFVVIALYGAIRLSSGAVAPSGDYAYNASKFVVNAAANTASYIAAMALGPRAIEYAQNLRGNLKTFVVPLTLAVGAVCAATLWLFWKYRKHFGGMKHAVCMGLMALLSLGAYAGLGGAAERYGYVSSIFVVLFGAEVVWLSLKNSRNMTFKAIVCVVAAVLIGWNIAETKRLEGQWKFAGNVVEQSIMGIKSETFPPLNVKTIYIIDMPIRYGRAWIFPTGMTDALWHMFRDNPYTVTPAKDLKSAFAAPFRGDREVFIYENYVLKRGTIYTKED